MPQPRGSDTSSVAEIALIDDSSPKSTRAPSLADLVPDPAPPPPQLRSGATPRSRLGSQLKSVTKAEAERRAREEKEYWDGWYRLLSCGTAPNLRDAESKTKPGAKAGVAGYADSDEEVDEYPGEGSSVGKCRVHGAWTGCAISCCCQEPTRRSRSFQDLREAVTPNASPRTSPRTSPRSSPSRGKKN